MERPGRGNNRGRTTTQDPATARHPTMPTAEIITGGRADSGRSADNQSSAMTPTRRKGRRRMRRAAGGERTVGRGAGTMAPEQVGYDQQRGRGIGEGGSNNQCNHSTIKKNTHGKKAHILTTTCTRRRSRGSTGTTPAEPMTVGTPRPPQGTQEKGTQTAGYARAHWEQEANEFLKTETQDILDCWEDFWDQWATSNLQRDVLEEKHSQVAADTDQTHADEEDSGEE